MNPNLCTYGIPPKTCGKQAVTMLPAKGKAPALFFCLEHAKIARQCFSSLIEISKRKDP